MLDKQDCIDALLKLGFIRESAARTDGSHVRFHHPKYPNLFAGITDHKNTKDMSKIVCKDLIKTIATFIWFETRDENNNLNFKKVNELLNGIDQEICAGVNKLLKKADGKDVINIVTQRLRDEVSKLYENVTADEVSSYIQ